MSDESQPTVNLVSTPDSPACGVGTYTGKLRRKLEDRIHVDHVTIPIGTKNPISIVRAAVVAGIDRSDIVHVQHEYGLFGPKGFLSWLFFPLLYLLTRIGNTPLILTLHEAWSRATIESSPYLLKMLYIWAMNKMLSNVADQLIFLSDGVQKEFESTVNVEHVTRISHGVAAEDSVPSGENSADMFGLDPNRPIAVEPGYVSRSKGQDLFVCIAKHLPNVQFLIAGGTRSERDSDFYDDLTGSLPENVTVTGILDETKFHDAFRIADVAILPYRKSSQSGVFNWCASHEIPVAGSRCEYFKSLADQYGCIDLFDVSDPDEAAEVTERLLDDEDRRSKVLEGLRKFKHAESFENVADKHTELYTNLIYK